MPSIDVPTWAQWRRPVVFERCFPNAPTEEQLQIYQLRELLRIVSEVTGKSQTDLRSQRRQADLVKARHIACWLMRVYSERPFTMIAKVLGDRDHSTIMYGASRVGVIAAANGITPLLGPEYTARQLWLRRWPPSKITLRRH